MPVLPSEYISNWYLLRNVLDPNIVYIFESWNETQVQATQKKQLIQGDIGTRVMDVGGMHWQYTVNSPALIFETPIQPAESDTGSSDKVMSAFGLLAYAMRSVQTPVYAATPGGILGSPLAASSAPLYILERASVKVAESGVNVDMSFVSDGRGAFIPDYVEGEVDYLARTARWYDTNLFLSSAHFSGSFAVLNADINFEVQVDKNYLIGTTQFPYFAISGYHVNGSMTVLMSPLQYENFLAATGGQGYMPTQTPGHLRAVKAGAAYVARQFEIQVGNADNLDSIRFGRAYLTSQVSRDMGPGQLTAVNFRFETYTNSSTPVTGEDRRV